MSDPIKDLPTSEALIDLIGELGREVHCMLDDCETSGAVGAEVHTITTESLGKVSGILDRIEALPFEVPGCILGPGAMLQEAIKQTFMRRGEGQPIPMIYRNWRGEVAQRSIRPAGLPYWGTTEWHPEPGWLLPAIDTEKGECRDFALKDCDFRIARQAEPRVICNGCGWEGDEDGLIATLDAEDGEPCRACPDCGTDANLMDVLSPQPETGFPQPSRKDGGEPCGECRLPAGETCDICGAVAPDAARTEAEHYRSKWLAQLARANIAEAKLAALTPRVAGDMVSLEAAIRAVEIATLGTARTTQERCVRALRKLAER